MLYHLHYHFPLCKYSLPRIKENLKFEEDEKQRSIRSIRRLLTMDTIESTISHALDQSGLRLCDRFIEEDVLDESDRDDDDKQTGPWNIPA